MGALEGKVALVTGASKGGTGTAFAHRLAAEGARIAITARSTEGLVRTQADIEEQGGEVVAITCDLSEPDGGRRELIPQVEATLGPIDILVNNAAMGGYKAFDEWRLDELRQMQEVNCWGPWELMQQALASMRPRRQGWILNMTTSVAELPPGPPFPDTSPVQLGSAYGATKASLNRMTLAAAAENQHSGVRVNALTPQAAILTPELSHALESGMIDKDFFEPLETMVEAALALTSTELNGRIAYSLQLLKELKRPVYDLRGAALVPGWQPEDMDNHLANQVAAHQRAGLEGPVYEFHRRSSPSP